MKAQFNYLDYLASGGLISKFETGTGKKGISFRDEYEEAVKTLTPEIYFSLDYYDPVKREYEEFTTYRDYPGGITSYSDGFGSTPTLVHRGADNWLYYDDDGNLRRESMKRNGVSRDVFYRYDGTPNDTTYSNQNMAAHSVGGIYRAQEPAAGWNKSDFSTGAGRPEYGLLARQFGDRPINVNTTLWVDNAAEAVQKPSYHSTVNTIIDKVNNWRIPMSR